MIQRDDCNYGEFRFAGPKGTSLYLTCVACDLPLVLTEGGDTLAEAVQTAERHRCAINANLTPQQFGENVATYVEQQHSSYDLMTKHEAMVAAVALIVSDMGAAQEALRVMGLDIDLYANLGTS